MYNQNDIKFFRKKLLKWFDANKRNFPWRKDDISDYELLVIETLLQRTKAETVAKYYNNFFGKYPDWESLQEASAHDLERILKPIGLYRQRAKKLLLIVEEHQNIAKLPTNKGKIQRKLAITSLYLSAAYRLVILKKKAALLDVNMSRVLSRFFNVKEQKDIRDDKIIQKLAEKVINISKCKELNWSILDFGALVCRSRKPLCKDCKLNSKCAYYNTI